MDIESRYSLIKEKFFELREFSQEEQQKSRDLFHLENKEIKPKNFEVYTFLVGLPIPTELQNAFLEILDSVKKILPNSVRMYSLKRENFHWELFILQRPNESTTESEQSSAVLKAKEICGNSKKFNLTYRGFLITPDGTIIARGFADFDSFREQFKTAMPYSSQKQSNLGHISIGRILDPVDKNTMEKLKEYISEKENTVFGILPVDSVKFIHETQWYMEKYQELGKFFLA